MAGNSLITGSMLLIKIRGIEETLEKLRPETVEGPVQRFLDRGAIHIQGQARELAPVDLGLLKNSINVQESTDWSRSIGPSEHYGPYVEFGTGPHWAPIAAIAPWANRKGLNPYAVQRSIAYKGTKAHPYMIPGLEASETYIKEQVKVLAAEIEAEASG